MIYTAELYWLASRILADRALRARTVRDGFEAREATQEAEAVAANLAQAIAGCAGDGAPPEALAFELLVRADSRILMKLGVSNRGEAAAAAHRAGLVRPAPDGAARRARGSGAQVRAGAQATARAQATVGERHLCRIGVAKSRTSGP